MAGLGVVPAGLRAVFEEARLGACAQQAEKWCVQNGAGGDLSEIAAKETFDMLVEELKLSDPERRRLRNSLVLRVDRVKDMFCVKNTFLTEKPKEPLRLTLSAPVPAGTMNEEPGAMLGLNAVFEEAGEEVDGEASEEVIEGDVPEWTPETGQAGDPSSPIGWTPRTGDDALYRTVTPQDFEQPDNMLWGQPGQSVTCAAAGHYQHMSQQYGGAEMVDPSSGMMPYQHAAFHGYLCTSWPAPHVCVPAAPGTHVEKNVVRLKFLENGSLEVRWTVDVRKVSSKDQRAVSPAFMVGTSEFKMTLRPRMPDARGGFSASKGCGTVELMCVEEGIVGSRPLTFRGWVGSPACTGPPLAPSEPVSHDFAQQGVRALPEPNEWNFKRAADKTGTFVVVLEVLAGACLSSGNASSSSAAAAAP